MSVRPQGLVGCLALMLSAEAAVGQIGPVVIEGLRPFGYFLGDVIALDVDVPAATGYELQRASLPKPGPVAYWLDLVRLDVSETSAGSVKHWRLHLEYQNFYAALDVRTLVIPGFALDFTSAGNRIEAKIPAWSFGVSPLREMRPSAQELDDLLRPDIAPQTMALHRFERAAGGFGAASAGLLLIIAFDRAWWPFRRRATRPFAAASRQIRADLQNVNLQVDGGQETYRQALLALHRSIDLTAGRRVLADDLPGFLAAHPAYRLVEAEFRQFFSASRRAFFGDDASGAIRDMPPTLLIAFCRRLANLERTAK
jgi:mxaA protein